MVKYCVSHPEHRCYFDSCGFIDRLGNVRVCKFHRNPSGRHMSRRVRS